MSHNNLQHALDLIVLWTESWQLSISRSKTQLLHLGTSIHIHTYLINGIIILPVNKLLDLGIVTDSDLRYSSNILSIISKPRSRTGIIFRSFFYNDISLLRQAFITYVRLIREYASQVWSSSVLKYISDLENVQRNFTYRIRSIKPLSYPERLAVLNLEPLERRTLKADLVMYYKIINNLISVNFDDHFTIWKSSSISTRSSGTSVLKPFCRTSFLDLSMFGTHYQLP